MELKTNTTLLKNKYSAFSQLSNIELEKAIQRVLVLHQGEKIVIDGANDAEGYLCLLEGKIKLEKGNNITTQIDANNTQPFHLLPETLTISVIDDAVIYHVNSKKILANNIELELVSFPSCPYGQRILITMLHNGNPHKLTLIQPGNLPAWFEQVSPLGTVPILRVKNKETIFESSVINDYLNQISDGRLLPKDSLHRAICCCWIEFCSTCISNFMSMINAPTKIDFYKACDTLLNNLRILEQQVDKDGPYFTGDQFTLVDSTYAPLFLRMQHLAKIINFYEPEELPKIKNWSENLLDLDAVQDSIIGDFSKLFHTFIQKIGQGGYVNSLCK